MRIAIVGAGLVGRLLAWRLSQSANPGVSICLIEAQPWAQPRSAAHSAAAMLAPISELCSSDRRIYQLGRASMRLWQHWLHDAGHGDWLCQRGSLLLAHPRDRAELDGFYQQISARLSADEQQQLHWLDAPQIARLEPGLPSRFERAIWLPDEAYLLHQPLLQYCLHAAQQQGVQTQVRQIERVEPYRAGEQAFDWVVDCRGMGAKAQMDGLRGVRGEVIHLHCPQVTLTRPIRLMHPRYQLYLVPRPQGQYILGATEIESEDRSPICVQSMLELVSALYAIQPDFAEGRIVRTDSNLRPAWVDNHPVIQQQPGLLRVNGLYRHGYLIAPALVQMLLRALQGEALQWAYDEASV